MEVNLLSPFLFKIIFGWVKKHIKCTDLHDYDSVPYYMKFYQYTEKVGNLKNKML